ncbi:MAG TPA: alcohol dehydrogenase catalytic domain-containing protein [Miltoncostaeaceae bacterium]|nr:alcohol dehydrogenase catalytic domain-containing protein [Miltoncostaeaceae bacterium]
MRAVTLHGPGDLRVQDVADPAPGPGEIVLRVLAAVTCATDAKMAAAGAHPALGPLPAVLGHEVAGVVDQVGEGVAWPRPGDAVVAANSAPCGACRACREGRPNLCADLVYMTGAFAERLRVPARIAARNVHALPAGMDPAVAATAEPLACAVHSAATAGDVAGRVVLVLGGGYQGRMLAGLLARRGAEVHVADPHPDRREAAVRAGAAAVHDGPRDPAAARALAAALPGGAGADLVVEAVGRAGTWAIAPLIARSGGSVLVHGGVPAGAEVAIPAYDIHYREVAVRGAYHHTPDTFAEALDVLRDPPFDMADVLHEPIGLDDVPDALQVSRGVKHPVIPGAS